MKNSWKISFAALMLASCAKERPVEKVYDFDGNRYEKSILLGSDKWMYKSTVIQTSDEGGFAFVGVATPMYIGRFSFERDKLRFLSNLSPYGDKGQGLNENLINAWDVEHSSYRLAESDGKVLNKEQEDDKIAWDQKAYFKIDWTSQSINYLQQNECFEPAGESVVEGSQEVTPEHFSFIVESNYLLKFDCYGYATLKRRLNANNLTYSIRTKHSFAPMPESDYTPLVYRSEFDENRRNFGFFETVVDRYNDKLGRFEKLILANRWNPEKEHTIYFAEDFPEDYKWIYNDPAVGIEARTNELFAQHGLNTRFKFVSDPNVKYGDVRYSFIKFATKYDDSAPLGYGPSDANPTTGEILRSDSVIWTNALTDYVRRLRDFERDEPGLEDTLVFRKIQDVFARAGVTSDVKDWLKTATKFDHKNISYDASNDRGFDRVRSRYELQKVIAANLYANPGYSNFTYHDPFNIRFEGSFEPLVVDYPTKPSTLTDTVGLMQKTGSRIPEDLQRVFADMGHRLTEFKDPALRLQKLKSRNGHNPDCVYTLDEQLAQVPSMIRSGKSDEQIIDTILYRVAIHEFGHNLNLRHNFYGSVDYDNFPESIPQVDRNNQPLLGTDGKPLLSRPISSSVMDYLTLADEYQVEHSWEAYDKAALLYAYSGGRIDLSKQDFDPATKTYSNRLKPHQFLYCSDEHRLWTNPFCNAFDSGTTPSEIAMSYIKTYARSYLTRNTAYGRAYWDTSGYASAIADNFMTPLKLLSLYDNSNSWLSQMSDFESFDDRKDYGRISQEILEDSRRAATLLAGFYAGVIKFTNVERDLNDGRDRFTGDVTRVGVFLDKLYATFALGGNLEIPLDSLVSPNQTNFVKYIGAGDELGAVVREQLLDIAVENIEWARIGLESFGRSLLVSTATEPTKTNVDFLSRMRVMCYTRAGLKQAFGIDADRYYPYYDGSSSYDPLSETEVVNFLRPLEAAVVKLGGGLTAPKVGEGRYPILLSNDFSALETVEAALVKIDNEYYVAPRIDERSGYAYEFMRRRITADNKMHEANQQYVKQSKMIYDLARFGDLQPCVDFQNGVSAPANTAGSAPQPAETQAPTPAPEPTPVPAQPEAPVAEPAPPAA